MNDNSQFPSADVTGVILAGGRGSRMGGKDKGLIIYKGKWLYLHVLERLHPQMDKICISANRNIAVYRQSGLKVIPDSLPDFPGPLAGMLSALENINTEWALFSSCDTPCIPTDLGPRLWQKKQTALAVWASSSEKEHPTLVLLHISLIDSLKAFMKKGERKTRLFLQQVGGHSVLFNDCPTAFTNINWPKDLST